MEPWETILSSSSFAKSKIMILALACIHRYVMIGNIVAFYTLDI